MRELDGEEHYNSHGLHINRLPRPLTSASCVFCHAVSRFKGMRGAAPKGAETENNILSRP